ncbi:unnamed protein product [Phaedon cochleariae]|uniref:Uncharacterized protein n=1 Tax=Phaedon cochleariae TaxID=80249 RepID=A0A9N9SDX8_PHACE|nr:unnamed protein product [Phaedon cochleariae]
MEGRAKKILNLAIRNIRELHNQHVDDVQPMPNSSEITVKVGSPKAITVSDLNATNDLRPITSTSNEAIEVECTKTIIDSVLNVTDDIERTPGTSKQVIEIKSPENVYYAPTQTGPTKLTLRKVSRRLYHEDSENEEAFSAEESDEYLPSDTDQSTSASDSENKTDFNSLDVNNSPIKKGKKRQRNPADWKRNKSKILKNMGKEYVSHTGKFVKEKVIKPPCSERCKLGCQNKLSEDHRTKLFMDYWKLGSLQRQRDFLGSCVEPLVTKYRRISGADARRRNCVFYLTNSGMRMRVCKTFLINTFGNTERTIRTFIQSIVSDNGMIPQDKRGKHGRQMKIDQEILESVRFHINSIPRVESHYLRANTTREFIDGGLSIAEMHRHYKAERKSDNKQAANYDTYARIFNTEFNIGFFVPRKDQCDLCESYKKCKK